MFGPFYALTAAVPFEGRALILHGSVHRERFLGRRGVQRSFLKSLAKALPSGCRPIVVTDAGFHAPWLHDVRALGWDYVSRVRGSVMYLAADGSWVPVKELHAKAKLSARSLGTFTVSKSTPIEHRLVVVRQRLKPGPKKRVAKSKVKPGPQKGRKPRKEQSRRESREQAS